MNIKKVPIIDIKPQTLVDNFKIFKTKTPSGRRKKLYEAVDYIWAMLHELAMQHIFVDPAETLLYDIQMAVRRNRFQGMVVGEDQDNLYQMLRSLVREDSDELERMVEVVEELEERIL